MSKKIHNPHDRFMKSLMGDIEIAREYFEKFLPDDLKRILDLSGLELAPHSFVSEDLQETFADIIFKCPLKAKFGGHNVFISILVEHKSFKYKYVAVQLGNYLFKAYQAQLDNNQTLTPVIPFLYYHGEDKGWVPRDMHDLLKKFPFELKAHIPNFDILFQNIHKFSDKQIRQLGSALLSAALLTQKYSHEPQVLVEKFQNIFSILESWTDRNLFHTLIVYYIELIEVDQDQIIKLIYQIPEVMKTEFISTADQLRQKGREEARQEARQELKEMEKKMEKDKLRATENMLRKGFEIPVICDVLEVNEEYVAEVKKRMDTF